MVEIGVTPCMGVWIETHLQVYGDGQQESHPVWVCGLKLGCTALAAGLTWSHPVWVCGLKRHRLRSTRWLYWSHPVWVCGLKLQSAVGHVLVSGHTLYGCVDWNLSKSSMNEDKAVTPCMGVWIETYRNLQWMKTKQSHPVWVCGLKRPCRSVSLPSTPSHPVWVCGLKLRRSLGCIGNGMSHPVWVCGLKRQYHEGSAIDGERLLSYPVWVCGLKHPR